MTTKTLTKTLINMEDNGGLTLKNYEPINYKSGYQVATKGIGTNMVGEAIKAINEYQGNCGIWKSNGIYYIDKSHRVTTKKDALKLGREKNQISILKWADMSLIYC